MSRRFLAGVLIFTLSWTQIGQSFAADAFVTSEKSPDQSYRSPKEHSIHTLRANNEKLSSELENGAYTDRPVILADAAGVIHRVSTSRVEKGMILSVPDAIYLDKSGSVAASSDGPAGKTHYAVAGSSNASHWMDLTVSGKVPDDAPLDSSLVSTKLSWTSFLLPILLGLAVVTMGFIPKTSRAVQAFLRNTLHLGKMGLPVLLMGAAVMTVIAAFRIIRDTELPDYMVLYQNAKKNLPVSLDYHSSTGHEIPVYDAYANRSQRWTSADYSTLQQLLDSLPANHLKGIDGIVSAPTYPLTGKDTGYSIGPNSAFHIPILTAPQIPRGIIVYNTALYNGALAHEIGHEVQFDLPASVNDEWKGLWNAGRSAMDNEDGFGEAYADWSRTSAIPGQSSVLNHSIQQAANGQPGTLAQTLFMAAQFADPTNHTLRVYSTDSAGRVSGGQWSVSRSNDALTLGATVFHLKDGQIVSADANGQTYAFSTPVTLTASADQNLR